MSDLRDGGGGDVKRCGSIVGEFAPRMRHVRPSHAELSVDASGITRTAFENHRGFVATVESRKKHHRNEARRGTHALYLDRSDRCWKLETI